MNLQILTFSLFPHFQNQIKHFCACPTQVMFRLKESILNARITIEFSGGGIPYLKVEGTLLMGWGLPFSKAKGTSLMGLGYSLPKCGRYIADGVGSSLL